MAAGVKLRKTLSLSFPICTGEDVITPPGGWGNNGAASPTGTAAVWPPACENSRGPSRLGPPLTQHLSLSVLCPPPHLSGCALPTAPLARPWAAVSCHSRWVMQGLLGDAASGSALVGSYTACRRVTRVSFARHFGAQGPCQASCRALVCPARCAASFPECVP